MWGIKYVVPNFYIYSAVCPATGEDVTLLLPWANTEMMNIFLEHMEAKLSGRQCLLVVDQAGWHISKGLRVPKNIEFIYLPSHSPELNPVERLWQWLKRHKLKNRYYSSLKEIEKAVEKCLEKATAPFLKSLCHCNYL